MRKSIRLVSLVLLIALLLSLFAGCGKEQEVQKGLETTPTEPAEIVLEELSADQKLQQVVTRGPGGSGTKEYTVMLYLVGSDLESDPQYGGCASLDIQEILGSGLDTSRVNFLIYTGGARYWYSNIPSDCNAIYQVVNGTLQMVGYTEAPANMGDPSTLVDFLQFSYNNFPANHYGLICWDHGAGPLGGYGLDEIFWDMLSLREMSAAFKASPVASKKLDFLGFDACLMASMEVAEMAAPYANYLIASEETEPGCGWNYSFLSTLNRTSDTKVVSQAILSSYVAGMSAYRSTPEYTLSCMDLSKVSSFRSAADKLFAKMAEGVKKGNYSAIAKARNKTRRFAQTAETPYDLVDMGHMANNLQSLYGSEVNNFKTALSQLVIQQTSNLKDTTGIAVYYPYDSKDRYTAQGQNLYAALTACTGYEKFIAAFTDYWINGEPAANFTEHEVAQPEVVTPTAPPATTPAAPSTTAPAAPAAPQFTGASVQLSADQLANLSEVTYTIFRADTDASSGQTVYIPVLAEIPLEPDGQGKVSLPTDQKLVVLKTDEEQSGIIWPSQRLSGTVGTTYLSIDGYLTTSMDTAGSQRIAIGFTEGNSNRMNILTLVNLGNAEAMGRSEPDLTQWEYIANRYVTLFPTCNNAGNLTAYTAWDDSGDEYYQILSYKDEFWLEQVPMTQLKEQFFVQIVIKDTQGNAYASKLTECYNGNTYSEYDQAGVIYRIYSDHAEVVDYTGVGGEVTIMEQVSGKPVTVIAPEAFYYNRDITYVVVPASVQMVGERAFANCRNMTSVLFMGAVKTICSEAFAKSGLLSVYLPEGTTRIEAGAFSGTPMPSVNIPSSVSYMGAGVFANCQNLIGVSVGGNFEGSSLYFKSVNGALLTIDGKELVQAPLGASVTFRVPEGVETIRSGAVRGSESMQEVVLPESLKHIGSYAFYDTVNLQSLKLPESLETIGHSAFGKFSTAVNTESPVTSVVIGPNVRYIGYDAFDAFPIACFTVNVMNQYYSSNGVHLLNKSGTLFIHAAYTFSGTLYIPTGVNHLAYHSLSRCDGIEALVLPDSVVSMDENIGLPDSMKTLTIGKGLACWDNVSDAYYLEQVTVSNENPYFVIHDGCVYSRDLTTLYACLNKAEKLQVADTVTTIEETAFAPQNGYNETLKEISLPATVSYLSGEMFLGCRALEEIKIDKNNPNYQASDGLVYTKNGVSLIVCPQGKTGTVSVKKGTSTIWRYAFAGQLKASKVVIPEGVMTIRKGNFVDYRREVLEVKLPKSLEKIYPDMFRSPSGYKVDCSKGSTADTFARSRGVEMKK